MTNKKITELPEILTSESLSDDDILPIVDVSEPNESLKNKKIKVSTLIPVVQTGRQRLTEDTTYYVNQAQGSDDNDGLTNNTAWKTIKSSLSKIEALDLNGFNVTLKIAAGNYLNEGLIHLPLLTGAKSETCFGFPEVEIQTHLDIEGPTQGEAILPNIEVDHFGYYSIKNVTIQYNEAPPLRFPGFI